MSGRMSSELQAIMRRRLAKSEQQAPVDEQMQDEISQTAHHHQDDASNSNSGITSGTTSNTTSNSNSNSNEHDNRASSSWTNNAHSQANRFKPLLIPPPSTSTSTVPPIPIPVPVAPTSSSSSIQQNTHSLHSNNRYRSSSGSGSGSSTSQSMSQSVSHSVVSKRREDSPFDEEEGAVEGEGMGVEESSFSNSSPRQHLFQRKQLKKTTASGNGNGISTTSTSTATSTAGISSSNNNNNNSTKDNADTNHQNNVVNSVTNNHNNDAIRGVSGVNGGVIGGVSGSVSGSGSGIQQHPYLKRYSPTNFTKPQPSQPQPQPQQSKLGENSNKETNTNTNIDKNTNTNTNTNININPMPNVQTVQTEMTTSTSPKTETKHLFKPFHNYQTNQQHQQHEKKKKFSFTRHSIDRFYDKSSGIGIGVSSSTSSSNNKKGGIIISSIGSNPSNSNEKDDDNHHHVNDNDNDRNKDGNGMGEGHDMEHNTKSIVDDPMNSTTNTNTNTNITITATSTQPQSTTTRAAAISSSLSSTTSQIIKAPTSMKHNTNNNTSTTTTGTTSTTTTGTTTTGLSSSHVTAMRTKLFAKTNPPPPPPSSPPPIVKSPKYKFKKHKSKSSTSSSSSSSLPLSSLPSSSLSISSVHDNKHNNNFGIKRAGISSSPTVISTKSREEVEITIDNNYVDEMEEVQEGEEGEFQMDEYNHTYDHDRRNTRKSATATATDTATATNDSNKGHPLESSSNSSMTFPSSSFFDYQSSTNFGPIDEGGENKQRREHQTPPQQQQQEEDDDDNEKQNNNNNPMDESKFTSLTSMTAFESLNDWSDMPKTPGTNTIAAASAFESFNDWSDMAVTNPTTGSTSGSTLMDASSSLSPLNNDNDNDNSNNNPTFDNHHNDSTNFESFTATAAEAMPTPTSTQNNWEWSSSTVLSSSTKREGGSHNNNNDDASFFQFDNKFIMEEGKDDNHALVVEDEFKDEPEIDTDYLEDDVIFNSFPIIKRTSSSSSSRASTTTIGAVKNPLTDNLVVCHQRNDNNKEWVIDEIDPCTSALVASTPISTSDIRQKISTASISSDVISHLKTQIICGIDNVSSIAIGLHRQHNRTRVRVAAIIDLLVLGSNDTICVVAIWQWGYASSGRTIMLQNVISSPPKGVFEPMSLCIADGLVFVAGTSSGESSSTQKNQPSSPVIYIAKPHVRDFWSMNKLADSTKGTNPKKIVYMAVTSYVHRKFKLLALALDDGSSSIWTYEKAVSTNRSISNDKAGNNQQLQLFCQLEGSSCLEMVEPTISTSSNEDIDNTSTNIDVPCCHISWISSCRNTSASIWIAVAFPNGVAVYLVPTQRNTSITLKPIAAAKTTSVHQSCRVAWIEIPRYPPCLSMLFSNSTKSSLIYGSLGLPSNGFEDKIDTPCQLITICKDELSIGDIVPWADMHIIESMKTIVSYENGDITAIVPTSQFSDKKRSHIIHPAMASLVRPVSSNALGLTSMGFANTQKSNDNVIHIHSQLHFEQSRDKSEPPEINNSPPILRQWLCLTKIGDQKELRKKAQSQSNDSFPTGGAKTEIICGLKCIDDASGPSLIPQRVVRNYSGDLCAVLFVPQFTSDDISKSMEINCDPVMFSVFHLGGEKDKTTNIATLEHGKDIVFLDFGSKRRYITLDNDGIYLKETLVSDIKDASQIPGCKLRIFKEGSMYDEKLDCHRLFVLSSNFFLFVVSRKLDSRYFLLFGGEVESFASKETKFLIDGETSKLWFNKGEKLISLIELPSSDKHKVNVAILTSSRILIVSFESSLNIIAEYELNTICSSLAPLGSHCVSFLVHLAKHKSKVQYLSSLSGDHSVGTIANLPASHMCQQNLYHALRPDRVVCQTVSTEFDQHKNYSMRLPLTKPAFLLEPLIANALSERQRNPSLKNINIIHSILERFGLKLNANPHNENEGVGTIGAGFTSLVYQMLRDHGYGELISNHLSRGKLLTPWIPITAKIDTHRNCQEVLQSLSVGDDYLSAYLQSADINASYVLPKPFDPAFNILSEYSDQALLQNKLGNALKAIDLMGSSSSHHDMASIILSMQLSTSEKAAESAITKLDYDEFNGSSTLAFDHFIRSSNKKSEGDQKEDEASKDRKKMPQLSPFYQSGICQTTRLSTHLIEHSIIHTIDQKPHDDVLTKNFDERKHVWNSGPFDDKEEIMLLDSIEEWTGRCHPTILGKEGAELAAESGQRTLQNLLATASDVGNSREVDSDQENSQCSSMGEWVEKVGEGRTDDDNLTLYLRFFEGADEDSKWRDEGLSDLSSFQNKPKLIQPDLFDIEATSSNVDEGESGTVRLLHDLVFNRDVAEEEVAGLFFEVKRGSSLDVGMFHSTDHQSRQRATLEFWFYLPKNSKEIVLARRSVCFQNGEDIESLSCVTEKENIIWELAALPSGRLEFRICGGESMDSTPKLDIEKTKHHGITNTDDDSDDEDVDAGLVSWPREDGYGGWNHVSLHFSCRGLEADECNVSLAMKGVEVCSSKVNLKLPSPGLEEGGSHELGISALMFGLGAIAGLRITELRAWACSRDLSDVKMMMNEYLDVAKIKKKIKLRIRGKAKTQAGIIVPPKYGLNKPKQLVAPPPENDKSRTRRQEVLDKPKSESTFFEDNDSFADFGSSFNDKSISLKQESDARINVENLTTSSSKQENDSQIIVENSMTSGPSLTVHLEEETLKERDVQNDEQGYEVVESCLLSDEVRKSAAAALIRGGPATRHFGGNRGGLPDERMKIGSIAICGAQKTVIFHSEQSPRGKTYPIGASGAVISDLMDVDDTDHKSEFLCCFLAKDKRMVVFELKSKKIVVELQMTTKLNFWRFLPPIAHGDNLCFLLITPVGGFHLLPLAESPRPRQVWKRGAELQGKKIVSYEEGGSNGLEGENHHSSVALVLSCTSTGGDPVEAWCLPIYHQSKPTCISEDTLGAALLCTSSMLLSGEPFNPLLVTVTSMNNGIVTELFSLSNVPLEKESLHIREILEFNVDAMIYDAPTMAMGSSPSVLCLCWKKHIVIIMRDRGLLVYYEFVENTMNLVCKHKFERYVVDAAMQSNARNDGIDITAMVCESDRGDGRIVKLQLG